MNILSSNIYKHKIPIVALLIACGLFWAGTNWYAKEHNGTLNIGRNEYNQARDLWLSHNVKHYRISVTRNCGGLDGCGTYDLEVDEADVKVHGWEFGRFQNVNNPPVYDAAGELFTIDALFHQVELMISGSREEYGIPVDYGIEFHPVYGFPVSIQGRGREPEDGTTSSMVWHVGEDWHVEDFAILP